MTIAGQHTLKEAIDLLETKNAQILATDKGYTSQKSKIDAADPKLDTDWSRFLLRWRVFFTRQRTKLAAAATLFSLTPNFLLPAEPLYQDILDELKKSPSYAELTDRFAKAGGTFVVEVGQIKDIDVDLEVYKKADSGIKAGEQAAKASGPWIAVGVAATAAWFWWTRPRR